MDKIKNLRKILKLTNEFSLRASSPLHIHGDIDNNRSKKKK